MVGKYEEAIEKFPDLWQDIAEEFVEGIVGQEFLAIAANAADSWLAAGNVKEKVVPGLFFNRL
jgi:hypothetical protein